MDGPAQCQTCTKYRLFAEFRVSPDQYVTMLNVGIIFVIVMMCPSVC